MIPADTLRKALAALADEAPNANPRNISDILAAVLAWAPCATLQDWDAYAEAYNNHFGLTEDGDSPEPYLTDDQRNLTHPDLRVEIAIENTRQERDSALDAIMAHHPPLDAKRIPVACDRPHATLTTADVRIFDRRIRQKSGGAS